MRKAIGIRTDVVFHSVIIRSISLWYMILNDLKRSSRLPRIRRTYQEFVCLINLDEGNESYRGKEILTNNTNSPCCTYKRGLSGESGSIKHRFSLRQSGIRLRIKEKVQIIEFVWRSSHKYVCWQLKWVKGSNTERSFQSPKWHKDKCCRQG